MREEAMPELAVREGELWRLVRRLEEEYLARVDELGAEEAERRE
jgi:hypothetical protein